MQADKQNADLRIVQSRIADYQDSNQGCTQNWIFDWNKADEQTLFNGSPVQSSGRTSDSAICVAVEQVTLLWDSYGTPWVQLIRQFTVKNSTSAGDLASVPLILLPTVLGPSNLVRFPNRVYSNPDDRLHHSCEEGSSKSDWLNCTSFPPSPCESAELWRGWWQWETRQAELSWIWRWVMAVVSCTLPSLWWYHRPHRCHGRHRYLLPLPSSWSPSRVMTSYHMAQFADDVPKNSICYMFITIIC